MSPLETESMNFVKHDKIRLRKPWYRQRSFIKVLVILILIGVLVYLVLFSSAFRQDQLIIEGNKKIDSAQIRESIQAQLDRRLSASLLWPIGKISSELASQFPYLQEAKIQRDWFHTLRVVITEKQPFLCLESANDLFILDANGLALEKLDECPVDYFILNAPPNSTPLQLGERAVAEEPWSSVVTIYQTLSIFPELDIKSIAFEGLQIIVTMFNSVAGDPDWRIYFDQNMDFRNQLRRLELFLQTRGPAELNQLDYVDLGSHGERVFYSNRKDNP